nr:uncharacterized protein LOC115146704 [Oncorhynchus nerka]
MFNGFSLLVLFLTVSFHEWLQSLTSIHEKYEQALIKIQQLKKEQEELKGKVEVQSAQLTPRLKSEQETRRLEDYIQLLQEARTQLHQEQQTSNNTRRRAEKAERELEEVYERMESTSMTSAQTKQKSSKLEMQLLELRRIIEEKENIAEMAKVENEELSRENQDLRRDIERLRKEFTDLQTAPVSLEPPSPYGSPADPTPTEEQQLDVLSETPDTAPNSEELSLQCHHCHEWFPGITQDELGLHEDSHRLCPYCTLIFNKSNTFSLGLQVCDTYPSELFVPKSATPPVIVGSSKFRSRGRLPVLTYFHQDTLAAICRCSQPLSGFSARSQEDEQMLEAIMKSNPGSDYIYVVDTRPKLNAMANRAAGKGYENEDHYANIKLQFIGIENIHVMRNSQQKIIDVGELKTPSMGDFLWGLESSGWLKHIKAVLDAGVFIAKAVAEEGISVAVHCSDGWDRTAQACSVASVLLEPYYRTMKGLMLLIERDWVSFGHKFSHRSVRPTRLSKNPNS